MGMVGRGMAGILCAYLLRQADVGYLVRRPDGSVSGSLRGKDMEGLVYV